jgi:hypothetical protein
MKEGVTDGKLLRKEEVSGNLQQHGLPMHEMYERWLRSGSGW